MTVIEITVHTNTKDMSLMIVLLTHVLNFPLQTIPFHRRPATQLRRPSPHQVDSILLEVTSGQC